MGAKRLLTKSYPLKPLFYPPSMVIVPSPFKMIYIFFIISVSMLTHRASRWHHDTDGKNPKHHRNLYVWMHDRYLLKLSIVAIFVDSFYRKCRNYVSSFPNSSLNIFRRSTERHNAALSGEQRPPNLNHCAVTTKVESKKLKMPPLGMIHPIKWTPYYLFNPSLLHIHAGSISKTWVQSITVIKMLDITWQVYL